MAGNWISHCEKFEELELLLRTDCLEAADLGVFPEFQSYMELDAMGVQVLAQEEGSSEPLLSCPQEDLLSSLVENSTISSPCTESGRKLAKLELRRSKNRVSAQNSRLVWKDRFRQLEVANKALLERNQGLLEQTTKMEESLRQREAEILVLERRNAALEDKVVFESHDLA